MTASAITLGDFLRSRRARLAPEHTPVPVVPGRRRVPGLRREELARLAGVSVDYYTRLEQGRCGKISPVVLEAIARALRLDRIEREHMRNLAEPRYSGKTLAPQRVRPEIWQLLGMLDRGGVPAMVLGRRTDLLAVNRMARALYHDLDLVAQPAFDRNIARAAFLDNRLRDMVPDWEETAARIAAVLRFDAGRYPDDPLMHRLVHDLLSGSPEFARLWARHDVKQLLVGVKRHRHPVVGTVILTYQSMILPGDSDQTLLLYSVEAGSPSEAALHTLAGRMSPAGGS
ncbi:helix-turn-helix transcriptional regulator [Sphaerisporangium rubeum]|uniref:Transcriptional regulator with XRE-family HTH domain n=1 Tax=Sphaerisporangium rubeum TaxID=321317 RepID=A0A7X0IEP8_9ACTN|nr:helix-turn-helix transcriptional regulator [Sphaerisporangium rubeum]MBB6473603.1 transcriptional regulator with XRE-family HTH domain [Sphaerisporangium rubeum]